MNDEYVCDYAIRFYSPSSLIDSSFEERFVYEVSSAIPNREWRQALPSSTKIPRIPHISMCCYFPGRSSKPIANPESNFLCGPGFGREAEL